MRRLSWRVLMLAGCVTCAAALADPATDPVLRVCADPNNLPLSNRAGEGYENRIAQALARDLRRRLEYTWFPQRMGFVRNTLRARDERTRGWKCDLIIGVPSGYELTATTRPYMRSTYALVFPRRAELAALHSAEDLLVLPQQVRSALRIGVFEQSPAADWLVRNGLLAQIVPYAQQSGDPDETPASMIERDLRDGRIDVAIVWGPIAGFLVARHPDAWASAAFRPDPQIRFDYEIAMGVRHGEKAWRELLDAWIVDNAESIRAIVATYRVPLLDQADRTSASNRTSTP